MAVTAEEDISGQALVEFLRGKAERQKYVRQLHVSSEVSIRISG